MPLLSDFRLLRCTESSLKGTEHNLSPPEPVLNMFFRLTLLEGVISKQFWLQHGFEQPSTGSPCKKLKNPPDVGAQGDLDILLSE